MTAYIGIDCGSSLCGLAVLEGFELREYAHCGPRDAVRIIESHCAPIVAIEQIQGYAFNPSRVKDLVETARTEGWILSSCHYGEATSRVFSAREARGEFCRTPRASDKQVAIVIEDLVTISPHVAKLKATMRPHVYDAALVALLAMRRDGVRVPPLSNAADVKLMSIQALENEKRTAKARAKKMAVVRP